MYHRNLSLRKKQEAEDDPKIVPHGTPHGYSFYGCRCDECVEANRDKMTRLREKSKNESEGSREGTV